VSVAPGPPLRPLFSTPKQAEEWRLGSDAQLAAAAEREALKAAMRRERQIVFWCAVFMAAVALLVMVLA
jgi:hypothetical protein